MSGLALVALAAYPVIGFLVAATVTADSMRACECCRDYAYHAIPGVAAGLFWPVFILGWVAVAPFRVIVDKQIVRRGR